MTDWLDGDRPRVCPVCWLPVQPTMHGNICGHMTRLREPCPCSFALPYDLALLAAPRYDTVDLDFLLGGPNGLEPQRSSHHR